MHEISERCDGYFSKPWWRRRRRTRRTRSSSSVNLCKWNLNVWSHTCALNDECTWLFTCDGGFGGGSIGLCCESDLKNISRFVCNWKSSSVESRNETKEKKRRRTKEKEQFNKSLTEEKNQQKFMIYWKMIRGDGKKYIWIKLNLIDWN